jgi:hypothetical protein
VVVLVVVGRLVVEVTKVGDGQRGGWIDRLGVCRGLEMGRFYFEDNLAGC